jgi:SAM-dependent methyltransferase
VDVRQDATTVPDDREPTLADRRRHHRIRSRADRGPRRRFLRYSRNSLALTTRRCNLPRVTRDYFSEIAAHYDQSAGPEFDPEVVGSTVDLLAELAGHGSALEFAIGNGRIALPLAARGVPVSGIELSAAMAEHLRAKDDEQRIEVTIGDMATTRVGRSFRLVYLVFNTIGNLTTQDQQVACFANAAAHLEAGGFFVIEVTVPDLRRLPPGEDARVFAHAAGYVGYDRYVDLVAQQAVSHHFVADGSGAREFQTPFRYAWPSELDLMAQLAGMSLRHRWAAWDRSPFNGESTSHVSVWEKQDDTSSRVS